MATDVSFATRDQTAREARGRISVASLRAEDLDAVTRMHMDSFHGYMNTRLGARYIRNFYAWFLRCPDAICLKAVVDGRLAGFTVGAPTNAGAQRNRDLAGSVFWSLLWRPHVFFHARIQRALWTRVRGLASRKHTGTAGLSLVGIAVAREFRRSGVGSALLQAFERSAVEHGHTLVSLSVYADNADAIGLYERAGWARAAQPSSLLSYRKMLGGRRDS